MDYVHIGLLLLLSALKRAVKNPASIAHLEGDIDVLLEAIYTIWPDKRPAGASDTSDVAIDATAGPEAKPRKTKS